VLVIKSHSSRALIYRLALGAPMQSAALAVFGTRAQRKLKLSERSHLETTDIGVRTITNPGA